MHRGQETSPPKRIPPDYAIGTVPRTELFRDGPNSRKVLRESSLQGLGTNLPRRPNFEATPAATAKRTQTDAAARRFGCVVLSPMVALGGASVCGAGLTGLTNFRGETCLYPKTLYQGDQR